MMDYGHEGAFEDAAYAMDEDDFGGYSYNAPPVDPFSNEYAGNILNRYVA